MDAQKCDFIKSPALSLRSRPLVPENSEYCSAACHRAIHTTNEANSLPHCEMEKLTFFGKKSVEKPRLIRFLVVSARGTDRLTVMQTTLSRS